MRNKAIGSKRMVIVCALVMHHSNRRKISIGPHQTSFSLVVSLERSSFCIKATALRVWFGCAGSSRQGPMC